MTTPYTERILSQDKKFYSTILDFISLWAKTRWSRPFTVQTVFPYGAVKITNPKNMHVFKVNG